MLREVNLDHLVVSSDNGHTSSILKYVDYQLQPIAKRKSLHVKDTKDFLK